MSMNADLVTIIVAALGTGGLGSAITAFLSRKKFQIEARHLEEDLRSSREEANRKSIDYIQTKMVEISKKYEEEAESLRKRNEELDYKISELNNRLQNLMEWVVVDNNRYRTWLETELRKLNPDIAFPQCPPAPIMRSTSPMSLQHDTIINNQQQSSQS